MRERPDADDRTVLTDRTGAAACAGATVVVVATDTSRHVQDALAALEAGARHVLVEKPLAVDGAQAEALAHHPRRAAVTVAAPLRGHRAWLDVVELAAAIGGPRTVDVVCQSWLPDWRPGRDYRESYSARPEEGGVLRDMVHELDYAIALTGRPRLLWSRLQHEGPLQMAAEQSASLAWMGERGDQVRAHLDYVTRPTRRALAVTGPDGVLEWDLTRHLVTLRHPDGQVTERAHPEDADRDAVMARQLTALLDGTPSPASPTPLDRALDVLRLCDDARALSTDHPRRTP